MPERKEQRDALVAMPTWTALTVKFYNHECVSIENEKTWEACRSVQNDLPLSFLWI